MAFFDDRLALPDLYTGHHAEAIAARRARGETGSVHHR